MKDADKGWLMIRTGDWVLAHPCSPGHRAVKWLLSVLYIAFCLCIGLILRMSGGIKLANAIAVIPEIYSVKNGCDSLLSNHQELFCAYLQA